MFIKPPPPAEGRSVTEERDMITYLAVQVHPYWWGLCWWGKNSISKPRSLKDKQSAIFSPIKLPPL